LTTDQITAELAPLVAEIVKRESAVLPCVAVFDAWFGGNTDGEWVKEKDETGKTLLHKARSTLSGNPVNVVGRCLARVSMRRMETLLKHDGIRTDNHQTAGG
jgi:hypothetical protein